MVQSQEPARLKIGGVAKRAGVSIDTVRYYESERWRLVAVLDRTRARLAELAALQENIETVLARCQAGHCELRSTPPPDPPPDSGRP
jgi:hypothetical protein